MSSIWTIRRSATDAKLTGLCAGVAEHWGIDPVLVRVACVLLALSGGLGLVLYGAGWLLIPVEGRDRAPVEDYFGQTAARWPKEVWIVVIAMASIAAFALLGSLSPFGVGPAVVIALVWYFGFYKQRRNAPSPTPPAVNPPAQQPPQFLTYSGPPTPFTEAAEAWRRRIEEAGRMAAAQQPPAVPTPSAAPAWTPPPPSGYRSPVTEPDPEQAERTAFLATADPAGLYVQPTPTGAAPPLTRVRRADSVSARRLRLVGLVVLGLTLAGLGVADNLGAAVPASAYAAAALLVVGLTLVAASRYGRARGLLPVGFLLVLAVLATSAGTQVSRLGDWSTHTVAYSSVSQLPPTGDRADGGRLVVDLSSLPVTTDAEYRAHIDVGQLEVRVPADTNVVVHYKVDLGAFQAYDRQVGTGTDLRGTVPADPLLTGRPTLTLDLSAGSGQVEVRR